MIFANISKKIRLSKISKALGAPPVISVENLLEKSDRNEKELHNLYTLVNDFEDTNKLLIMYKVDENKFKDMYSVLLASGAGQWIKGNWVPASSLATAAPLEYILKNRSSNPMEVAFNLCEYFRIGKIDNLSS